MQGGLRRWVAATVALIAVAGVAFSTAHGTANAAGPCSATCFVNAATGSDANGGASPGDALKTIQAGIDRVNAGGTVKVYPGSYSETAAARTLTSLVGTYDFGLFVPDARSGITVQGVTASGFPVLSAASAQATVTTNATNNFGPSGVFIEGDGVTIRGLRIGTNSAGQNKTIEVIGDDFTLAGTDLQDPGGSVYINDFRFDTGTNSSHVRGYSIVGNRFAAGLSLDIASGAGFSGPRSSRVITGNSFDLGGPSNSWPAISFNGSGTPVPWFTYGVGGALIFGNSFQNGGQYIRARGDYDNTQFDWASYWNLNSFDRAVVVGPNPPGNLREFSYTSGPYTFNHVRHVGAVIQEEIDHAQAGDTVLVKKGSYTENLTISTPLTLQAAGQTQVTLYPALSAPNPPSCAGSLCPGASNVILVQADNVTITGLTINGDNPSLTGGVSVGGADLNARNGIITNHNLGLYNNLVVHHVTVKNVYLRGMYASSGGSFNFNHNTVTNVQADYASIAIFAYGGGPGTMADNTVSWANDAISANHSKGIQFLRNTVTHSGSGVHTDNAGDGGGVADLIKDNVVTSCKEDGYGIWVFVPYIAPSVTHNTISGCAVGLGLFGGQTAQVTVFDANDVDGTGATVSAGDTDGMLVLTDTFGYGQMNALAAFKQNVVRDFAFGAQVIEQAGANATATFDGNLIRNHATGVDTQGAAVTTLTGNCIRNNTTGVLNELLAATSATKNAIINNSQWGASNLDPAVLNFENNFWGAGGPHTVGPNRISANVDATPFWSNDHGTCDQSNWRSVGAAQAANFGDGNDGHGGGPGHGWRPWGDFGHH